MDNELSSMIDHTQLNSAATKEDIKKLCDEAKEYNFKAVCVNPSYVPYCVELLEGSNVEVATVIGFPLGADTSETKAFETLDAIEKGATEVDMVINIGALKDKKYDYVKKDIESVVRASNGRAIVKVIIETCLLTDDEIKKVSEIILDTGADFVKTSTGFSTGGAKTEDVSLIKSIVGNKLGIKASGGIRDRETALKMVSAGATRLGASSGIKIVTS